MQVIASRTFKAAADLAQKILVKLAGGEIVANTVADTDEAIGVNDYAVASGDLACVNLVGGKTLEITAAGVIAADAAVYAADGGKVQELPVAAGTYVRIGTALEAAGADGDIVEILPLKIGTTVTVSA
ncbi:MAG: DUF2190 family protein [Deltaproteobacteria bacterium]|nr:DUF2190 family protein [Deltaproteobacteria bacterium]